MHTNKYLFNLQLNLTFGMLAHLSNKLCRFFPLNLVNLFFFMRLICLQLSVSSSKQKSVTIINENILMSC